VVIVFEFGGASIAQGAVQPGAVTPGDVLHDGAAGSGPGGLGLGVDQLALHRGEKALRHDVVPALALAADRQGDLAVTGEGGERGPWRRFWGSHGVIGACSHAGFGASTRSTCPPSLPSFLPSRSRACPILGAKRERLAARTCGHMRLDAASVAVRNMLTSVYSTHHASCSNVCVVRDEEAAGSNPATPTSSEGI